MCGTDTYTRTLALARLHLLGQPLIVWPGQAL